MCKFADWDEYHLTCGAEINGICTPTPFNYQTIDDFYSEDEAKKLKLEIEKTFPNRKTATVVEALASDNKTVREYAQFLFDNDYSLYSAKQWGVAPSEIDPSILKRVPLRFNYDIGYFDDKYQVMPHVSFTAFFEKLLEHENIEIELNTDALDKLKIKDGRLQFEGHGINYPVVYSGPLDELFGCCYGQLPYRSLQFEWIYEDIESRQDMPVVAYPQAKDFVRIIEYKKLPVQNVKGTTYEVEYSLPYKAGAKNEPYYPVLTEESQKCYEQYAKAASEVDNLYVCGRLGNFKYYNMDQALEAALNVIKDILP
jgi:UDP-galactopyranose mutase